MRKHKKREKSCWFFVCLQCACRITTYLLWLLAKVCFLLGWINLQITSIFRKSFQILQPYTHTHTHIPRVEASQHNHRVCVCHFLVHFRNWNVDGNRKLVRNLYTISFNYGLHEVHTHKHSWDPSTWPTLNFSLRSLRLTCCAMYSFYSIFIAIVLDAWNVFSETFS